MVRNEYGKGDLEIANNAGVLNSFGPKIKQSLAPKLASKPHYCIQQKKKISFISNVFLSSNGITREGSDRKSVV